MAKKESREKTVYYYYPSSPIQRPGSKRLPAAAESRINSPAGFVEFLDLIYRAIHQLKGQSKAVTLDYLAALLTGEPSIEEIARRNGISEARAEMIISRTRSMIRNELIANRNPDA